MLSTARKVARWACGLAMLLPVAVPSSTEGWSAEAQAPSYGTVRIVRDVTFATAIETFPDNEGTLHIDIDLELQPDGTLAGSGSYVWHWQWADSPNCGVPLSIWHGELSFEVAAVETDGVVSLIAPDSIAVSNRNLWEGCTYREVPDRFAIFNGWNVFDVRPEGGRFAKEEHQRFEILPGPVEATVTTEVIATPAPGSGVSISARHDIIPGYLTYFNELSVTVTGSPQGATVLVKLAPDDKGLLFESRDGSGRTSLRLSDLKSGEMRTIFYAWQAPRPDAVHRATVTATLEATGSERTAAFDVGVNFEVVSAGRMFGREIEVGEEEPLRVTVRDAFHPDRDVAALANELGLRPVLSIKGPKFVPQGRLGQFVNGLSFNTAGIIEFVASVTIGGNAVAIGNQLAWNVDGNGALSGEGVMEGQARPSVTLFDRGVYYYDFDIAALTSPGGPMPEPDSPSIGVAFPATKLDPNAAFFYEALVPCIQELVGALKDDPVAQLQALWECLHMTLGSEIAQQAIGHNVMANTIGAMVADAVDAAFEFVGHKPGETLEERQDQILDLVREQLETEAEAFVAVISKGGVEAYQATSSAAGPLEPGPATLDISLVRPATPADQALAAEVYAPRKRLQDRKHVAVVVGQTGETVWLDLTGSGVSGELVIVTGAGIVRAPYPVGDWQSRVQIGPDGSLSTVSGAEIAGPLQPAATGGTPEGGASPSGPIGGGCTYRDVPGIATILRVRETAESARQATVEGGPGYEGLEVIFSFISDRPISETDVREFAEAPHTLRLANSWYPGPAFLQKYEIRPGQKVAAVLRVRTAGPCTPMVFMFPGIDLADYFETG